MKSGILFAIVAVLFSATLSTAPLFAEEPSTIVDLGTLPQAVEVKRLVALNAATEAWRDVSVKGGCSCIRSVRLTQGELVRRGEVPRLEIVLDTTARTGRFRELALLSYHGPTEARAEAVVLTGLVVGAVDLPRRLELGVHAVGEPIRREYSYRTDAAEVALKSSPLKLRVEASRRDEKAGVLVIENDNSPIGWHSESLEFLSSTGSRTKVTISWGRKDPRLRELELVLGFGRVDQLLLGELHLEGSPRCEVTGLRLDCETMKLSAWRVKADGLVVIEGLPMNSGMLIGHIVMTLKCADGLSEIRLPVQGVIRDKT
jgi:hypothetical protein